jgi:60 kDa SS-A/Ro ribonucleoprotein
MHSLETFLILGGNAASYRAAQSSFDEESAKSVQKYLREGGVHAVRSIEAVAASGSALSNDAALFALALASSPQFADPETNAAALGALPQVARTGAHLCKYAAYVGNLRGWGRGLRSAVADWYTSKPAKELAAQILKHRHRRGWSHRDLLRLSHPKPPTPAHNAIFQWAVEGELGHLAPVNVASGDLRQIYAFEQLKRTTDETEMVRLIEDYRLTYDMIPAHCRKSAPVWEALLGSMPFMAMVRNLGNMTTAGLISRQSAATALVVARLMDRSRIRRANVHPVALLSALMKYKNGPWETSGLVAGALEDAFHFAFDNVEASGKRILFGIDSGLIAGTAGCTGMPHLTPCTAIAALAMEFARVDAHPVVMALRERPVHIELTKDERLTEVCRAIAAEPRSADPSSAIEYAISNGISIDCFVFVSDRLPLNELEKYREQTGIAAKLILISPAATAFDEFVPSGNVMRIAGFDATVPRAIRYFMSGAGTAAAA